MFFFVVFLFIHHHLCTRIAPFCIGDLCSVCLFLLFFSLVLLLLLLLFFFIFFSNLSIAKTGFRFVSFFKQHTQTELGISVCVCVCICIGPAKHKVLHSICFSVS